MFPVLVMIADIDGYSLRRRRDPGYIHALGSDRDPICLLLLRDHTA